MKTAKPLACVIEIKSDVLIVSAPYSEEFVRAIKEIPAHARAYNEDLKHWRVDLTWRLAVERAALASYASVWRAEGGTETNMRTGKQVMQRGLFAEASEGEGTR